MPTARIPPAAPSTNPPPTFPNTTPSVPHHAYTAFDNYLYDHSTSQTAVPPSPRTITTRLYDTPENLASTTSTPPPTTTMIQSTPNPFSPEPESDFTIPFANNPINKRDPSGLMTFGSIGGTLLIDHESTIGKITIDIFQVVKSSSFLSHKRGLLISAKWTPPTGGVWDQSPNPLAQAVAFRQDTSRDGGKTWQQDWSLQEADTYGYMWRNFSEGSFGGRPNVKTKSAGFSDEPSISGPIRCLFSSHVFLAKTYAVVVLGEDKGKVYAQINWGYKYDSWNDTVTPTTVEIGRGERVNFQQG